MLINQVRPQSTPPVLRKGVALERATVPNSDLFSPASEHTAQAVPRMTESTKKPSTSLRDAFESISTPIHDSKLRLLSDNAESWTARWDLLKSAETEINAQYYAWNHDVFGMALLGHIYHKASQGVTTRVMVDAVGDPTGRSGFKSHLGGRDYLQELVALPNAEARVYHPNHQKLLSAVLHPTGGEGIAANHDKILEVDGKSVIAGGRNISHHYYMHPDDNPEAWRDTDLLLTGTETATEFRDAFDIEFNNEWITEKVGSDKFGNWKKRSGELIAAYAMMEQWLAKPALSQADKQTIRQNPAIREQMADDLVRSAQATVPKLDPNAKFNKKSEQRLKQMAGELVEHLELMGASRAGKSKDFAHNEVKVIDTTSAVGKPKDEMNEAFVQLIDSSQKNIAIQSPYFVLTDGAIDALTRAGERGVNIDIATNTPSSSDSAHTQVFFMNDWKKALASIPNLHLHGATGQRKMHGKMAIFDDSVTVVSSYNMDLVSKEINGEVGAVVWSPDFAKEARQALDKDFQDATVAYQEYGIERTVTGQALDAHGRLVLDEQGQIVGDPVATFGPEDHVESAVLDKYAKKVKRWNWIRRNLPQFRDVRRFAESPEA